MISDVLFDAATEIRKYLEDIPEAYVDYSVDIERLLDQMDVLRARLDDPLGGVFAPGANYQVIAGLSDEAMSALIAFSRSANRSVLHPLDRQRLLDFLFRVDREGARIDEDELETWLQEDGWPHSDAREFTVVYTWGRDLLARGGKET